MQNYYWIPSSIAAKTLNFVNTDIWTILLRKTSNSQLFSDPGAAFAHFISSSRIRNIRSRT